MKKTYTAPDLERIDFQTGEIMGPSYVIDPDDSVSGDGGVTDMLPLVETF